MENKENKKTVFRRIRGRIVPISVSVTGAAIATNALRTKRVYDKSGMTIDRTRFAFQPFAFGTLGNKLTLKKSGKLAATARTYVNDGTEHSFSWLSVKKEFRGQGLSNIIAKQAAVEVKDQGGKTFFNHVVHPNSANLFGKNSRNKYHLERIKKGYQYFEKISKEKALNRVKETHLKGYVKNPVFRETFIPSNLKRTITPFRTLGNKMKIGLGIGLALAGASMMLKRDKK